MSINQPHTSFSRVHFSSITPEWSTPDRLFDQLNSEFSFDLDVCASQTNAKCGRYFTKKDDALTLSWVGTCWMNPPYGRQISKWIQKAYESSTSGHTVVCLLPAKTDTVWFHEIVTKSNDIRFIARRLKFGGSPHNAPFASMVVVFHPYGKSLKIQPKHLKVSPGARAKA